MVCECAFRVGVAELNPRAWIGDSREHHPGAYTPLMSRIGQEDWSRTSDEIHGLRFSAMFMSYAQLLIVLVALWRGQLTAELLEGWAVGLADLSSCTSFTLNQIPASIVTKSVKQSLYHSCQKEIDRCLRYVYVGMPALGRPWPWRRPPTHYTCWNKSMTQLCQCALLYLSESLRIQSRKGNDFRQPERLVDFDIWAVVIMRILH